MVREPRHARATRSRSSRRPTDPLRWYVRATDAKGLATNLPTKTITIRRCDTEATFYVNDLASQGNNFCPPKTTSVSIPWTFSITDPDGMVERDAQVHASRRTRTIRGPKFTKTKTVQVSNGRFNMQSVPLDGDSYYGYNQVTWTITTRDQYDGTSTDSTKGTFQIWVC